MNSRRFLIVLLSFLLPLNAQEGPKVTPKSKPWEKLVNVTFKPQKFDDGDSFQCTLQDGNELILRLYFVDTPEEEKVYADRIKDQAEYFGVSEAEVMKLGHESSAFTKKLLEKPFTVWTRWHKALGRSKQERWYCSIITHDGKDLAKELVRNGYARIYGTKTVTYDGKTSKQFVAELEALEIEAKKEKRGGWGIAK